MSSFHRIFNHFIIATKNRVGAIDPKNEEALYRYLWGVISNKGQRLIRINGMNDHIHLLVQMTPDITPQDFLRDIKRSSSLWASKSGLFPYFEGWARHSPTFSVSYYEVPHVKAYIINQKDHHTHWDLTHELGEFYGCGPEDLPTLDD